jgi:hypothetical protein
MKRLMACVTVAALATGMACDTEQPAQRSQANIVVEVETLADVLVSAVYDVVRQGNPDTLYKLDCSIPDASPTRLSDRVTPWPLAVEISVIPAGSPTAEILATTVGGEVIPGTPLNYSSIAGFDEVPASDDPALANPPPPKPPSGGETYSNGRWLSFASREYLLRCTSLVPDNPPPGYDFDSVLPVQIINQEVGSPTYSLKMAKGDTVVVKIRKIADLGIEWEQGTVRVRIFAEGAPGAVVEETSTTTSSSGVVAAYTLP